MPVVAKAHRKRRRPGRLLLVIAGKPYRLSPFVDVRPNEMLVSWKHILRGKDRKPFGVYWIPPTRDQVLDSVRADRPCPSRHRCEKCGDDGCAHVDALVDLELL